MLVDGTASPSQKMPPTAAYTGRGDAHRLVPATLWALEIALTNGEPKGLNHTLFQQNNSFVRGVLLFL